MAQNALYNQTVKESRQMDADRFSERIVALHAEFIVPPTQPDTVLVDATLSNEGPLPAQIITIWVICTDGNVKKYGLENALDINLKPGDKVSPTIPVTVPGGSGSGTFSGWLVTARGNLVSLEKKKSVVQAQVASGIGSIQMNFTMFKYYEVNKTDNSLIDYPEGNSAFKVPAGKEIVFAVSLSNWGLEGGDITLNSDSKLWVYLYKAAKSLTWDIVNVERIENRTVITETFTNVTLPWGEPPRWIFFGPTRIDPGCRGESGAVNLLLNGWIDSEEYGQNLPFVSIYVI